MATPRKKTATKTAKTGGRKAAADATAKKKKLFLDLFELKAGNISATCRAVNIDRATFYRWRDDDEDFARGVADGREALVDWAEACLRERMGAGDITAIIFFLKTQGRARGYNDRVTVDSTTRIESGVLAVPVLPGEWEQLYCHGGSIPPEAPGSPQTGAGS